MLQGPATQLATLQELHAAITQLQTVTVRLVNYKKSGEAFVNELTVEPLKVRRWSWGWLSRAWRGDAFSGSHAARLASSSPGTSFLSTSFPPPLPLSSRPPHPHLCSHVP